MLDQLVRFLRTRSRERKLEHYAIADPLWQRTIAGLPFLHRYGEAELAALRELATLFIAEKEYSTAHELVLTDEMVTSVAVQACVPILRLGMDWYQGWHGIVLYPGEFIIRRTVEDEIGLVHGVVEEASGEAWSHGPVILSWEDAGMPGAGSAAPPDHPGDSYNVVIHEFAHKLDMLNGEADGVPPFSRALHVGLDRATWAASLHDQYDRFADRCDAQPDDAWDEPDRLPPALRVIDPYGSESPGEFFAVASEAFFVEPSGLSLHWPTLYRLLAAFYRQDPAQR
ncbi:M90 family metallopeptidase [Paracidovorax citrulli]